jgi:predicted CoA-substrate-specific enzyme activase
MPEKKFIFAGVDVGASRTKVAILDSNSKLMSSTVRKSGTDFTASAKQAFKTALKRANISENEISKMFSTGYGRKNVTFAQDSKTEISCHARGCYYYFPITSTIIDIGGQDNKIIKIDKSGQRIGFKMNRKCAAGTGAFLEEMSLRLAIPLQKMNGLAKKSTETVELGSYCTVFSATEVLEKIRQGKKVSDIVKGLFLSVIKRVMEMDSFTDKVVMTGGVVAHNPYLVTMVESILGREVLVPEFPQITGAIGAALLAMDSYPKK